jgi:hypothetical protein
LRALRWPRSGGRRQGSEGRCPRLILAWPRARLVRRRMTTYQRLARRTEQDRRTRRHER